MYISRTTCSMSISRFNNGEIVGVPSHYGVKENEILNGLAKGGSITNLSVNSIAQSCYQELRTFP